MTKSWWTIAFYQGFSPSKCIEHRCLQCFMIILEQNSLPHGNSFFFRSPWTWSSRTPTSQLLCKGFRANQAGERSRETAQSLKLLEGGNLTIASANDINAGSRLVWWFTIVPRPQNNCEPLEMMPWYTIVSPGFWGIFQFFLIFYFLIV
jgi:hypothetical protein